MIGTNPDCPPGVALLADHLDAILAAGEDLLASSLTARADLDEADPQGAPEALDVFVRRLHQLEASLVLRLLQARKVASEIGRADPSMKGAAALFRAQTDALHDLIAGSGRSADGMLVRAGDSNAYIRSRGMIAPEAAAPSPFEALSVDDHFRLGGVVQLSQVLDFVATTLDLLDIRFGLYMPDLPDETVPEVDAAPVAPEGEAGPAPVDSLASVLARLRSLEGDAPKAAGAEGGLDAEDVEAGLPSGESSVELAQEDAEAGASGVSAAGAPTEADKAVVEPVEVAKEPEVAEGAKAEKHETGHPPGYRSLASLIAEVERATERMAGDEGASSPPA